MVSGESYQETRDNIGSSDDTRDLVSPLIFDENIYLEEGPTQLQRNSIGSSFVLGHATNGILGATGMGLGMASDYVSGYVESVINPKNTFHEHFRYTDFNDTDNSTGTFDTTNYLMVLDKNEIYQSKAIFKNNQSIYWVTPYISFSGGSQTFTVDADSDGTDITIAEGS